ncbi:MAG: sugar ABC transporter permease [Chloroflexota bacterium]
MEASANDTPSIAAGRVGARRSFFTRLGEDKHLRYLLLSPAVLLLLAMTVYPYIYALRISTYAFRYGKPTVFIGLANYERMLADAFFWESLFRTILFSAGAVMVELVIGLVLALLANRTRYLRGLIRPGLMLPMSIAPVVVAIIWRLIFNEEFGVLNFFLDNILGLERLNWLGSLAFFSIFIIDVWQWTPFMFLIILAGLQSIPVELFDAAYVDGASEFQLLRYVTLPLLDPTILIAVLVRTVDALRIFDQVFLLTQGGPGTQTEFVSLFIYKTAFKFSEVGYASALLLVLFIVTVGMALIYIRLLRHSAETGQ